VYVPEEEELILNYSSKQDKYDEDDDFSVENAPDSQKRKVSCNIIFQ